MSDIWEWIIPAIIIIAVALAISLIIIFLTGHPFISGVLVGLIAGIGGTTIYYRAKRWVQSHRIVKIQPSKK